MARPALGRAGYLAHKAGGTWLACAEDGLVLTLLNYNPRHAHPEPRFPPRQSRGLIIPGLIGLGQTAEVARALQQMDFSLFPGFRLVGIDAPAQAHGAYPSILEATWTGRELTLARHPPGPACFASSGLGDHRVSPRLELFQRIVVDFSATAEMQDAFHRHTWPAQPEISVMMSREDARTVSVSTVEVTRAGGGVQTRMDYQAVPETTLIATTGSLGEA